VLDDYYKASSIAVWDYNAVLTSIEYKLA